MAQPIALEIPSRDPGAELRKRLDEAHVEHAEALLDSYELLQQLHDHGVFDLLRGALCATDKLVESVADAAKSDESVRAIRNAIILGKMLGSVDPDVLQSIATAVGETFENYEKRSVDPPGLFSLLNQLRRKEMRRSIALISHILGALGKQIQFRAGKK